MNEKDIKLICKQLIEHSNQPIGHKEKEIIKQAIDDSKNLGELLGIALVYAKTL